MEEVSLPWNFICSIEIHLRSVPQADVGLGKTGEWRSPLAFRSVLRVRALRRNQMAARRTDFLAQREDRVDWVYSFAHPCSFQELRCHTIQEWEWRTSRRERCRSTVRLLRQAVLPEGLHRLQTTQKWKCTPSHWPHRSRQRFHRSFLRCRSTVQRTYRTSR